MTSIDREPRGENEPKPQPIVGIVMGSESDLEVMIGAVDVLKQLEIPYSIDFMSAHRTPDEMINYAKTAKERGLKAIIAGAGGAAHLPGMIKSETLVPVIGVPIVVGEFGGVDALLSEVQMPKEVPVNVMAMNGAVNAALSAAEILANEDEKLYARLVARKQRIHDEVVEKNERLKELGPEDYLKEMKKDQSGGQI